VNFVDELKTDDQIPVGKGPAFAVKATLKGLEIIYGILLTVKKIHDVLNEIREMQSRLGQPLVPEEAMKVLRISKTKLGNLRSSGAHIDGVHYWQDGSTVRYFPDFASKPLKPVEDEQKETSTSDDSVPQNSHGGIDQNY